MYFTTCISRHGETEIHWSTLDYMDAVTINFRKYYRLSLRSSSLLSRHFSNTILLPLITQFAFKEASGKISPHVNLYNLYLTRLIRTCIATKYKPLVVSMVSPTSSVSASASALWWRPHCLSPISKNYTNKLPLLSSWADSIFLSLTHDSIRVLR